MTEVYSTVYNGWITGGAIKVTILVVGGGGGGGVGVGSGLGCYGEQGGDIVVQMCDNSDTLLWWGGGGVLYTGSTDQVCVLNSNIG